MLWLHHLLLRYLLSNLFPVDLEDELILYPNLFLPIIFARLWLVRFLCQLCVLVSISLRQTYLCKKKQNKKQKNKNNNNKNKTCTMVSSGFFLVYCLASAMTWGPFQRYFLEFLTIKLHLDLKSSCNEFYAYSEERINTYPMYNWLNIIYFPLHLHDFVFQCVFVRWDWILFLY